MPAISNLVYGTVQSTELRYFTGGLVGRRVGAAWAIGPILRDGHVRQLGPIPDERMCEVAAQVGIKVLGTSEITLDDPHLPSHIWKPSIEPASARFTPADRWGLISNNARIAGDDTYAELARYVEVSLRAAGIRLRDAADQYHRQLVAGLHRGQGVDLRFKNVSQQDLHVAFHSLLAELGAARDYLASIVARELDGINTSIDSLAKLVAWTKKQANAGARQHALVAPLLEGVAEEATDRWMYELTDYRNTFLHREPLGARNNDNWLLITTVSTSFGTVHRLRFNLPRRRETDDSTDALDKFAHIYGRMQGVADFLADNARFPDTPLTFTSE